MKAGTVTTACPLCGGDLVIELDMGPIKPPGATVTISPRLPIDHVCPPPRGSGEPMPVAA